MAKTIGNLDEFIKLYDYEGEIEIYGRLTKHSSNDQEFKYVLYSVNKSLNEIRVEFNSWGYKDEDDIIYCEENESLALNVDGQDVQIGWVRAEDLDLNKFKTTEDFTVNMKIYIKDSESNNEALFDECEVDIIGITEGN